MPPKYKPGGRTFPPKSKQTSLPRQAASSIPGASPSSSSGMEPEAEDQLEIELCWCIQQLQMALDAGKLSERQTLDTNKTLNVLKSNTAPLIKKRQFMRTTFGDYRTKMANDQKKLGKISTQVKFSNSDCNPIGGNKKSVFIKKATASATNIEDAQTKPSADTNATNFRIIPSGNDFKFNFSEPEKS